MSKGTPAEMIEAPTIKICPSHWADVLSGLGTVNEEHSEDALGFVHTRCVAIALQVGVKTRAEGESMGHLVGCPVCYALQRGAPDVVDLAIGPVLDADPFVFRSRIAEGQI